MKNSAFFVFVAALFFAACDAAPSWPGLTPDEEECFSAAELQTFTPEEQQLFNRVIRRHASITPEEERLFIRMFDIQAIQVLAPEEERFFSGMFDIHAPQELTPEKWQFMARLYNTPGPQVLIQGERRVFIFPGRQELLPEGVEHRLYFIPIHLRKAPDADSPWRWLFQET